MTNYKQIDMRFWQNDFVLGLTPEERYFYMYLVTNTMANKCGIYKFNMKVAELETGYTAEIIEKQLESFEGYGKIVVSRTTKEIMLVNWFKHNFKNNKKTILEINKELKDVKNKDFIQQLYDICLDREYPVDEIFNGIALDAAEKEQGKIHIETLPENSREQDGEQIEKSQTEIEELAKVQEAETPPSQFLVLQGPSDNLSDEVVEEEIVEENVLLEDDEEDIIEGTTIAYWSFDSSFGDCYALDEAALGDANTAVDT